MLECFVNQTTMGEPAVECGSYARIRRNSATNLQPQFDLLAFELSPTFEELPVYSRRKSEFVYNITKITDGIWIQVFAEQYDPEADESTEKVVHPKTDKQRQRLGEAVRNILLFRALEEQQMREVLDAMYERKVSPGEVVIQQGDDGDNFYVIESGIYHAFVGSDKEKGKWNMVGKYENSGSFGELALMYNMPRAATVKAATDGSLWVMLLHNNFDKVHHLKKFEVYGIVRPRNGDQAWLSARKLLMSLREGVGLLEYAMNKGKLKLFKDRHTFRRIVLKSAFIKRKEYEKLLDSVPMLKSLELYERMNLCDALMPKHFKKKELIIRQGAKADGMYFIEEGSVRITMIMNEGPERGKEVEMSCLHKGQYFGELALVTHKPRAASVYAASDVKLAFLDVHAFERLLGPCMNIMRRNIDDYEKQVVAIFGSKANISDLR